MVLQIELFWRRSLGDHDGQVFCLVDADLLDYRVSQKAADSLDSLLQYNSNDGIESYFNFGFYVKLLTIKGDSAPQY